MVHMELLVAITIGIENNNNKIISVPGVRWRFQSLYVSLIKSKRINSNAIQFSIYSNHNRDKIIDDKAVKYWV